MIAVLETIGIVLLLWILLSFALGAAWVISREISLHAQAIKKDRAEAKFQKRYFEVTEEFQNDFD